MGLTLLAILATALLLPGILAMRSYYRAGRVAEADPVFPPLSGVEGLALAGVFCIAVHAVYAILLAEFARLPALVPLPLADPYAVFALRSNADLTRSHVIGLLLGLIGLGVTGELAGRIAAWLGKRYGDPGVFHGPLADILTLNVGPNDFINAYVLTKTDVEGGILGYQGTVVSLIRDADRFPVKVVMRNVAIFYLELTGERPRRREVGESIDWIALSSEEWRNIAFRVILVEEDMGDPPPVTVAPVAAPSLPSG